jgi:hypothetical protein
MPIMPIHFRLSKRSGYPYVFLVLVVVFNTIIYYLAPEAKSLDMYIAATGGTAGFVHFLYTQHNQNTQLFVSLFKEFNSRYDLLNGKLNNIVNKTDDELSSDDKIVLFDYFNLCAEEYLFYKAGYIDKEVWHSWLAGMKHFTKNTSILSLWESDLKEGSYYGFNIGLFDKTP